MKKRFGIYGIIAIAMLIIAAVMIFIYVLKFGGNSLSDDSGDWDAFGSYLGAITGILAFIGVLWSMYENEKYNKENKALVESQNKETSERDTFFKLLDLHANKFNSVEYVESTDKSVSASEAFKKYAEEANNYLKHVIVFKFVLDEIDSGKAVDNLENLFYNRYHQVNNIVKDDILKVDKFNDTATRIKILRENLQRNEVYEINHVESAVEIALKEKPLPAEDLYEYSRIAADAIYHKYGHITGHYFRNLYYAMKITSEFSSNNDYRKLLRAQISRYEIAMNLYNALSSRSSPEMIDLLNEYNLFKDQYIDDVYLLQILPQGVTLQDLLTKSKTHIENEGRIGR